MRQYFYLVGHYIVGDDFVMDKVFLQKSDAMSYGKRLSRHHPEYSVCLYKQLISNSSSVTIEYVKDIQWTKLDESVISSTCFDDDLFGGD